MQKTTDASTNLLIYDECTGGFLWQISNGASGLSFYVLVNYVLDIIFVVLYVAEERFDERSRIAIFLRVKAPV